MKETDISVKSAEVFINASLSIPMRELNFRTSRSGGPGGQNVNKTETKVELIFSIVASPSLNEFQRETLKHALTSRLDTSGNLHVVCSEERSQLQNKARAIAMFSRILAAALKPKKKRVATAPTKSSKERRLKSKKIIGERKKLRARRDDE